DRFHIHKLGSSGDEIFDSGSAPLRREDIVFGNVFSQRIRAFVARALVGGLLKSDLSGAGEKPVQREPCRAGVWRLAGKAHGAVHRIDERAFSKTPRIKFVNGKPSAFCDSDRSSEEV